MSVVATIAQSAWLAASLPAHRRFQCALAQPATTQRTILREFLRCNATTAYGRAHGFHELRSYADFAARVPIVNYEMLAPWIARIQRGESNVLTTEPVLRLVPTSGSTSARKLIPFTASLQREFNRAIGPWLVDLARQHPSIALGPAYWSVTPAGNSASSTSSSVPIGFDNDSEYLGGTRARLVEAAMAVPSVVSHIEAIAPFRYVVLLCLLRCGDLRLVSVWHPSFFSLLLDALPSHWDSLLADLAAGTCRGSDSLPDAVRTKLHFRRASALVTRLRRADPTRPETIWPKLRLVSCWADANAAGAAIELKQRLPFAALQSKGLLATEAFVTLPFQGAQPVAVNSHFFEFRDDAGIVYPLEGIRSRGVYEVIVTTRGGLCRYRLGDLVEVTGFCGRTPSLRFLGRADSVSDLCGEKLSEGFVAQSIRRICASDLAPFSMLAPERHAGRWAYTLFFQGSPAPDLASRLEHELCENPQYRLCRRLGQLAPASVRRIVRDGYECFVRAETARGIRLGDLKPIALSRRTDWGLHFLLQQRCDYPADSLLSNGTDRPNSNAIVTPRSIAPTN